MRLIDADALIAEYDRVHVGEPGNARKLMQDAPTIEQPVRKGTWVSHWEHCKREKVLASGLISYFWCSCCNRPSLAVTNFCPNCGALMSEGEEDED